MQKVEHAFATLNVVDERLVAVMEWKPEPLGCLVVDQVGGLSHPGNASKDRAAPGRSVVFGLLHTLVEVPVFTLATMSLAIMLGHAPSVSQAGIPAVQPAAATPAASALSGQLPVPVQLSTLVDHGDGTLAGHVVALPALCVSRIVSSSLVELRDAREDSRYRFHGFDRRDRLLAVLPAGANVQKGDNVLLSGIVRTVRGAGLTGELAGVAADWLKDRRNRVLLVAASVSTPDGIPLR